MSAGDGRADRSQSHEVGLPGVETVKPSGPRVERSGRVASPEHPVHRVEPGGLWEFVFSRDNLAKALQRVERNKGAPGVDGITTEQLRLWLREHWPAIREVLDAGRYKPSPVRRVEIPKPDGGVRLLGVPTVSA